MRRRSHKEMTRIYNEQEHKAFIKSQIVKLKNTSRSLTEEQLLDSLTTFGLGNSGPLYVNKSRCAYSEQCKQIFGNNVEDKFLREQYRYYFLRKKGFKYCCNCKIPKDRLLFYSSLKSYDGLDSSCKNCSQKRSADHRLKNSLIPELIFKLVKKLTQSVNHLFVIDHKISKSNGGIDNISNFQVLTYEDNARKSNNDHIDVFVILHSEELLKYYKNLISEIDIIKLAKLRYKEYLYKKLEYLND